jgi:hypothetical protein
MFTGHCIFDWIIKHFNRTYYATLNFARRTSSAFFAIDLTTDPCFAHFD